MNFDKVTLTICMLSIIFLYGFSQPKRQVGVAPVQKAENFTLLDHTGKSHELYFYSDKKAIVLVSHGNGCPIVRHSITTLNELKKEFEPQDVLFLMINANPQDDRFSIAEEARKFNITIPILEDRAQIITESFNITRTAEAILIDPTDWSVRYRGAIDDRLGYETQKTQAGHHYLKDAVNALLNGNKITAPSTAVKGCLINLEHKTIGPAYSYNQHVAPILRKKCLKCHSSGGMAPWTMNDYQTVKGWAPMIREVIRTKRMPPFKPDPYYGKFKNDISLTPEEVRTIVRWVEQGCIKGDGEDYIIQTSKPKHDEWPLGKPDIVFNLKEKQTIPATGILPYRYVEADKTIDRDIWIKGGHLLPGNPKLLHHSTTIVQPPTAAPDNRIAPHQNPFDSQLMFGLVLRKNQDYRLIGYGPGSDPFFYPDNMGRFVPKGSKIIFELHYTPSGKPESDDTKLGLYLHNQEPSHIWLRKRLLNLKFRIPPGAKDYKINAFGEFPNDTILYMARAHMHTRGKSAKFIADYPDGSSEILLSIPEYNFYWQHVYFFNEPKKIPGGTRIICEGVFDNSSQNPLNPDPTQFVEWGPQSDDEMFGCHLYYKNIQEDSKNQNGI